jgi:RNA polymerase sigma factor (sigma-70 family)
MWYNIHIMVCIFILYGLYTEAYQPKMITRNQWKDLRSYIVSKETTPSMKQKVNYIIFHRHLPLVYSQTYMFRRSHYRKARNIYQDDMLAFAYKGLHSAVSHYNGNYSFVKYAKIYINGALYDALTEHNQISVLTKNERRRKNGGNIRKEDFQGRKAVSHGSEYFNVRVNFYLNKRDYLASKIWKEESEEEYQKKWAIVNTFPLFVRRCFHYKFDFYFNRLRTNRRVGELMCCSEELVRRHIAKYILILVKEPTVP